MHRCQRVMVVCLWVQMYVQRIASRTQRSEAPHRRSSRTLNPTSPRHISPSAQRNRWRRRSRGSRPPPAARRKAPKRTFRKSSPLRSPIRITTHIDTSTSDFPSTATNRGILAPFLDLPLDSVPPIAALAHLPAATYHRAGNGEDQAADLDGLTDARLAPRAEAARQGQVGEQVEHAVEVEWEIEDEIKWVELDFGEQCGLVYPSVLGSDTPAKRRKARVKVRGARNRTPARRRRRSRRPRPPRPLSPFPPHLAPPAPPYLSFPTFPLCGGGARHIRRSTSTSLARSHMLPLNFVSASDPKDERTISMGRLAASALRPLIPPPTPTSAPSASFPPRILVSATASGGTTLASRPTKRVRREYGEEMSIKRVPSPDPSLSCRGTRVRASGKAGRVSAPRTLQALSALLPPDLPPSFNPPSSPPALRYALRYGEPGAVVSLSPSRRGSTGFGKRRVAFSAASFIRASGLLSAPASPPLRHVCQPSSCDTPSRPPVFDTPSSPRFLRQRSRRRDGWRAESSGVFVTDGGLWVEGRIWSVGLATGF
ncbi:hypothetical protein MSAN_01684300 [Mycena sanguinolenta]|uniref:Uncharacterized protein n=1 Tax=Mycena sanguinolenta TaxID=230812 RepID=A0A8H6XWM1_9AGAR|nr:hypothetical protein MSAN_01684300 [Mycena sanguinolenta]